MLDNVFVSLIISANEVLPIQNACFLNPEIKVCFIKVLQEVNEEVLPQELSIDDDEYKLIEQCLKRRRDERIRFRDLKEELEERRLKIKSGAAINIF